MAPDTRGRAAAPPAPTPIREAQTPREEMLRFFLEHPAPPPPGSENQARRLSEPITKS